MAEQSEGLKLAIAACGGVAKNLADGLGISPQAISQWSEVPWSRVIVVESLTGVHRSKLRPDIYPPENREAV